MRWPFDRLRDVRSRLLVLAAVLFALAALVTIVLAVSADRYLMNAIDRQRWGPASFPSNQQATGSKVVTAVAPSRAGTLDHPSQPATDVELSSLGRFDGSALEAARLHLFAAAFAPLLMLGILCFAYFWIIQFEVLRWIELLKAAMLAGKAGEGAAIAPVDAAMPEELRDLATAYNELARESSIREQSLKASLAENEFLLRELNHRVKSSLQIIQSYMSLTRRLDRQLGEQTSVAAMEARIQVLSIAYRKAFSEGRMRDVRIGQFAEEIVDNLGQLFERPGLALQLKADVVAALMIDRAIPLGLALVESVMAGLEADRAQLVSVRIGELDDLRIELRVSTDGALRSEKPNAKLMAGLALQLAASVESPDAGSILRWRFQAGPPPVLLSSREAGSSLRA